MNFLRITGILAFLLVSFFTSTSSGFARYSYGDAMANFSTASSSYVDTASTTTQTIVNISSDVSYTSSTSEYSYQENSTRYDGRRNSPGRGRRYPPIPPPPPPLPPPSPVNGVCSSSLTGPQSFQLTTGACDVGSVVGFTADGSNPINYSWACSGSDGGYQSQTCNASYYVPPVIPPPRSGGVVSLTFDDGWMSQYQNALPILDSVGIKGTFGIIAGYMQEADYTKSTHDYYMNTDEVKSLAGRGHEIASHTYSHADLSLLDTIGLSREVIDSRTILQNAGLGIIETLIYPYGIHTPTIDEFVKSAGYTRARTVDNGYNTLSTDHYSIMTQSVNVDTPLSQVQAWIDYAQSNNVWLVLVFHQIDTSGSIYSSTPDTLQGIVNYIQKTGIQAMPMREALAILGQ